MIRAVFLSLALIFMAAPMAAAAGQSMFDLSREKLKIALADALTASHEFKMAEEVCREALALSPQDTEAKILLADIYASEHKYSESIAIYDQVLFKKYDVRLSVKKARILGWGGRYNESLAEYRFILKKKYDPLIELEMLAIRFYWNHWVLRGIKANERLVAADPKNTEALFHLTQIYAHEGMWADAKRTFELLRQKDPNDIRAVEGLEELRVLSQRASWNSGFEHFKAYSPGRQMDIYRSSIFNKLTVPLQPELQATFDHRFTIRAFHDHKSVDEEEFNSTINYRQGPQLWGQASYSRYEAASDLPSMNTFSAAAGTRLWDLAALSVSADRERLENSSGVLIRGLYADNYLQRLDWDLTQRLKLGTDYLFAQYSDDNFKHEPGADILYYVSYEPDRLYLKYRVFYRDFNHIVPDYFSPQRYWVHQLRADWRHYFDTNDVYFGRKERYYGLAYDIFFDSKNVISHHLSAEFRWQIARSMTVGVEAFFSLSSSNIYRDRGLVASFNYSF